MRKTPTEWFNIWSKIIENKKEISRRDLSDLSLASIWTIKALTKDFVDGEAYITHSKAVFKWWTPRIELTLSNLSDKDKERLK
ncbi:hypothetical protein LCGC14_2110950 [marine sediment metagenome]|uniref:Uncharacterized protein n=1 Tax=marine sediment metagenome TaxID=412755 RepID=A0A0F9H3I8_9ZZZZ